LLNQGGAAPRRTSGQSAADRGEYRQAAGAVARLPHFPMGPKPTEAINEPLSAGSFLYEAWLVAVNIAKLPNYWLPSEPPSSTKTLDRICF